MIKVSVLTILVLQLLGMLVEVSGQSDCSQYFTYITKPSRNEIWGEVSIPSPPRNVSLRLRVSLSIAVRLSNTSYVGQIQLAQSKENTVLAIEQGRPLLYNIRFPLRQQIPIITSIRLNNQLYCTGPHALGSTVSSYVLEHSLYPTQIPLLPTLGQTKDECGYSFTNITINQLISTKVKISPGEWPWLVAIFRLRETIVPLCVGTLLTNRHVLTGSASLMNETGENIPPAEIIASLGRYRLTDWQETGSVNKLIENYTIHPEYRLDDFRTHAGLGILVLRTSVAYSSNIKPICLWSGPSDLYHIVGKSGYVVGWGRNDISKNHHTEEPRMSRAPIISQEDCLKSFESYFFYTSKHTFCAGLTFGSGPCNGDIGSGLMLYNASTNRYELRGIVAGTFVDVKTLTCIVERYIVYVDVAKHMDWINQQISIK